MERRRPRAPSSGVAGAMKRGVCNEPRRLREAVRGRDAIITPLIESDLVLLASWKSAVRIESDPVGAEEEEEPSGSGTTGTGEGAVTGEGGNAA